MAVAMSKDKKKPNNLRTVTHPARLSFVNVYKPRAFKDGAEPQFSVRAHWKKNVDLSSSAGADPAGNEYLSLKKICYNAIRDKWGEDKKKWPKNLEMPFRDGDEDKDKEGHKGTIYVNLKAKTKPGIVDQSREDISDDTMAIYSGCWARLQVAAFAYETGRNVGVSLWLDNIQKVKDDTQFSGKQKAAQAFGAIEDESDDEDNYDDDDDSEDEDDYDI